MFFLNRSKAQWQQVGLRVFTDLVVIVLYPAIMFMRVAMTGKRQHPVTKTDKRTRVEEGLVRIMALLFLYGSPLYLIITCNSMDGDHVLSPEFNAATICGLHAASTLAAFPLAGAVSSKIKLTSHWTEVFLLAAMPALLLTTSTLTGVLFLGGYNLEASSLDGIVGCIQMLLGVSLGLCLGGGMCLVVVWLEINERKAKHAARQLLQSAAPTSC